MKRKIIARVLAVASALILVVALAVPCFADERASNQSPIDEVVYNSMVDAFWAYGIGVVGDRPAAHYVFDRLQELNYGDNSLGIFNIDMLCSCYVNDNFYRDIDLDCDTPNAEIVAVNTLGAFCIYYKLNGVQKEFKGDSGTVTMTYRNNANGDPETAVISFSDGVNSWCINFVYQYGGFDIDKYVLNNTVYPINTVADIDIAFAFDYYAYNNYVAPTTLTNLLYGGTEGLYFPKMFYLGYYNGASDYYYNNDYEAGYQDAIKDIDSGEFGENFLGNLFSAPARALNSFTLITTPNGVDITIGGLLACVIGLTLFFALIKMLGR